MHARWRLLQLADSAFPAGGFVHSGGLEAALALGEVAGEDGVERFAGAALWQAGTFALPFVREAHRAPEAAAALDERCEAAQASHVARRASRAQGRAWLRTCAEAFAIAAPELPLGHLPVAFGATARALGLDEDDTLAVHLHVTARGVLSAAVRLGAIGPHAAQRAQDRLAGIAAAVQGACAARPLERAAHAAPVQELCATLHDTLPARLFQS